MIAFVNVQHSGTGFVLRGLLKDRYTSMETPDKSAQVAFTHVSSWNAKWLERELPLYDGWFTVTRWGTEESWRKRGMDLGEFAFATLAWNRLVGNLGGIVIHLDSPAQRQDELDEVNRRFGLSLSTDWARVPSLKS